MMLPYLVAAAVGLVAAWFETHRPWGGFCTFGMIARRAALTKATSIGVFIVEEEGR